MENTAENKYLIDSDSYEMFDNITRFAKNLTLKNSKELYDAEDALSTKFGNYLIKYFNSELINSDIVDILNNVYSYNEAVEKLFNENKYYYTLGIPKEGDAAYNEDNKNGQPEKVTTYSALSKIYDASLFKKIIEYVAEEITKNEIKDIKDEDEIKNIKDTTPKRVKKVLLAYSFDSNNGALIRNNDIHTAYKNVLNVKDEDDATDHEETKLFKSILDYYKDLNPFTIKIMFFGPNGSLKNTNGKRSASSQETTWAENGEQVVFFDLENIVLEGEIEAYKDILKQYRVNSADASANTTYKFSVVIAFKELNKKYRDILKSPLQERVLALMNIENKNHTVNPKYISTGGTETAISSSFQDSYRNFSDKYGLLVEKKTTFDVYRYLHTNPYIARKSGESAIIAYYYGDNYKELSNGYGRYSYQKKEINSFLDIYEETRIYFYKVLLNKSFINESFYPVYERIFLIFTAIERFMTHKIDSLKDIDSMDSTDMKNFMNSFGMGALADAAFDEKNGTFMNKETYIRKLLHNYIGLIHEKGSKAVIDKIINIFDSDDINIDITKYVLYDNEFSSAEFEENTSKTAQKAKARRKVSTYANSEPEKNERKFIATPVSENRLNFVETKYFAENNNATREIIEDIAINKKGYSDFLTEKPDKYWLAPNDKKRKAKLDESDILLTGVPYVQTKYLGLKVSENLSHIYLKARYFLSFIISAIDKMGVSFTDENKIAINGKNTTVSSLYKTILFVFTAILKVCGNENNGTHYWINVDAISGSISKPDSRKSYIKKYISIQTAKDDNGHDIAYLALNESKKYLLVEGKANAALSEFNNMIKGISLLAINDFNNRKVIIKQIDSSYNDTDTAAEYQYVFEHGLSFIQAYINGDFNKSSTPYTAEFYKLCDDIFETFFTVADSSSKVYPNELSLKDDDQYLEDRLMSYISNNASASVIEKDSEGTSSFKLKEGNIQDLASKAIDSLSNLLIELVNSANSIFDDSDYSISFSVNENITRLSNFMEAAITYFISYTSQIRDSSYTRVLDSKFDSLVPADDILINFEDTEIDNVFYDEQFSITETKGDN